MATGGFEVKERPVEFATLRKHLIYKKGDLMVKLLFVFLCFVIFFAKIPIGTPTLSKNGRMAKELKPKRHHSQSAFKINHLNKVTRKTKSNKKGRVINTHPISAVPIHQVTNQEGQKNRLLDFKSVSAVWLKDYPIIKQEVEKIILKEQQQITADAKELFKENPHSNLLPYRLYVKELKLYHPNLNTPESELKRNKKQPSQSREHQDIVSVRMKIYTYTGGAHGGSSYYSWNWSKKTKKFLSLTDLLSARQFAQLVEHTRNLLFEHEKRGNSYDKYIKEEIQRGTNKPKHFKIWNLHQNEIVIMFPEYQVASYAAGSFEVYIPFSLLL